MTALVADSRAHIQANERLLYTSRHLIAASRRVLACPWFNISGASGETDASSSVRRLVRILLAGGALWPIRGRVTWAGYGSGHSCCVCGQPVTGSEVEYEVEDGSVKQPGCHFGCFVVWHEESQTFYE